jgi:phage protein U
LNDPLLQIGWFQFSISTAAYDVLNRQTAYRWASSERFGQAPAKQFVGMGDDTIEIKGTVYPHWRGGLYQLDDMRALAAQGKPQNVVAMPSVNTGVNLGLWVIEEVTEEQGLIRNGGIPARKRFTLRMSAYGA